MLAVDNVGVSSPLLGLNGTLSHFELRKTGISFGTLTISPTDPVTVGNFASLTGVTFAINNLVFDTSATQFASGQITLTIGNLSLFPNGNFVQSNFSNITASYGFGSATDSGKLTITIGSFEIAMGEALKLDASAVVITPGAKHTGHDWQRNFNFTIVPEFSNGYGD